MNRRTLLASLLVSIALAGRSLAADFAVNAPAQAMPPVASGPAYLDQWSGIYLGLEGGYGWGRQRFDNFSLSGFDGLGNLLNGSSSVPLPAFAGVSVGGVNEGGGMVGGFAGAQKQFGNWVFGIEADFDGASVRGSVASSAVQPGVTVSQFQFSPLTSVIAPTTLSGTGAATVMGVTTGPIAVTVPSQTAMVTGTATVDPVTGSITSNTVTIPAAIMIPINGTVSSNNPGGTNMIESGTTSIGPGGFPITGNVAVPGQMALVTGTATVPAVTTTPTTATVPGQSVLVNVTVPFAGAAATTSTAVLQQFEAITTVNRTVEVDTRIDDLSSVRGKIGYTLAPNWLIYGTGGLALAHATNNVIATESFVANFGGGPQTFSGSATTSGGVTLLGWALGAGFDWKWPGHNWALGAEYLHYEFPKNTINLSDNSASVSFLNSRQSVDAVKGRISYLFPIH